jgi:hypothetical protein
MTKAYVVQIYKKYQIMKQNGVSQDDPEFVKTRNFLQSIQDKTALLKRQQLGKTPGAKTVRTTQQPVQSHQVANQKPQPHVAVQAVESRTSATQAEKALPDPYFDQYPDRVDELYKLFRCSNGSHEYELAFEASSQIEKMIHKIESSVTPGISLKAKQEALGAINDIVSKVLTTEGSCLYTEIRNGMSMYAVGSSVALVIDAL